ncbi:helix-turn-helix domain-containing protein [Elizabethkingia anophelis]|uniref:helix-turn-helix domain-containing protein n=1 Tax=Elizabethkingia anophelis TaxID=1117645 RepID=UPI001EE73307|nr:helix-turn-helix domain-containing protein [Elizabethkingia anophelis]UKY87385.1 helix-turn-helix domain-containing protein [Elizabethkingia anophelis]UKZ01495.1 helix-turn-helix domain-containing protein [Elizabethkingia anophelis]
MCSKVKEFFSFKEALSFMDVSASTLYKMTSGSRITFYKPNNGKIYFKREDLESWIMRNERKSLEVMESNLISKIKKHGK